MSKIKIMCAVLILSFIGYFGFVVFSSNIDVNQSSIGVINMSRIDEQKKNIELNNPDLQLPVKAHRNNGENFKVSNRVKLVELSLAELKNLVDEKIKDDENSDNIRIYGCYTFSILKIPTVADIVKELGVDEVKAKEIVAFEIEHFEELIKHLEVRLNMEKELWNKFYVPYEDHVKAASIKDKTEAKMKAYDWTPQNKLVEVPMDYKSMKEALKNGDLSVEEMGMSLQEIQRFNERFFKNRKDQLADKVGKKKIKQYTALKDLIDRITFVTHEVKLDPGSIRRHTDLLINNGDIFGERKNKSSRILVNMPLSKEYKWE